MRDIYVCNVRLIELEPEPTWGEHGGEGKIELAVCKPVVKTLGQWHNFIVAKRWARNCPRSKDWVHTSCPDTVEREMQYAENVTIARRL